VSVVNDIATRSRVRPFGWSRPLTGRSPRLPSTSAGRRRSTSGSAQHRPPSRERRSGDERSVLEQLLRENARLRMERDILRKGAAFFASDVSIHRREEGQLPDLSAVSCPRRVVEWVLHVGRAPDAPRPDRDLALRHAIRVAHADSRAC
jgi:hypothetical protein